MKPTVSIIIPVYNHQDFIASCIKSVLAQTYNDWEIITINDGSTDDTAKIIKGFSDQRIRYIYQEHIGVYRLGETYNKALSLAKGEFIAILEGDDYWPEYKLERQIPLFDNPRVILSYGDCFTVNEKGRITKKYRPGLAVPDKNIRENRPVGMSLKAFLQHELFSCAVTVCLRKNALLKIGGFISSPYIPAVDSPTFCALAMEGEFGYLPEPLGYWRQHSKNTTLVELFNFRSASFRLDFINKYQKRIEALKTDINISQIEKNLRRLENKFNLSKEYWKAATHLGMKEYRPARQYFLRYLKRRRKRFISSALSLLGIFSSYTGLDLIHLVGSVRKFINTVSGHATF
ncbi:MAG: glycosyltransferase [Planctomycetes bacterium]|nr:glycosyltransferase [Planctomycetota bacterium]